MWKVGINSYSNILKFTLLRLPFGEFFCENITKTASVTLANSTFLQLYLMNLQIFYLHEHIELSIYVDAYLKLF